jgi:hypothetical protein
MDRCFQVLLIVSTAGFSWLGTQAVHELGHVAALGMTGGSVDYVILHPLAISYTHPAVNPHPLPVAWGGVVCGALLPLAAHLLLRRVGRGKALAARPHAYLSAFFAGSSLVANGAYLAGDAVVRGGDARDLIALGSPPWLLVLLGLPMIALGLFLWNGLGPSFGLGPARGRVDRRAAAASAVILAVIIVVEVVAFGPGH